MTKRHAARRVLVAGAAGIAGAVVASPFVAWQAAVMIGWSVAAVTYLARVWTALLHQDAAETAAHATQLDESRVVADGLLLVASLASLVAVGLLVVKASSSTGATKGVYAGVAVMSVVLSWALVHTVFTLRYSHLYYGGGAGVDFGCDPTYRDFAYLAFTIGMTYQVSDTGLRTTAFRSIVLRHALLSFVFGTAIIATTINLVAGLRS